jgi:hypothetical protein
MRHTSMPDILSYAMIHVLRDNDSFIGTNVAISNSQCGKEVVIIRFKVLWPIIQLLGKYLEIKDTRAVATQRHSERPTIQYNYSWKNVMQLLVRKLQHMGYINGNESVFYVVRVVELSWRKLGWHRQKPHVKAGSNTSTVTLRVIGGHENVLNTWGYNRDTLFPGDINKETGLSKVAKSRIGESKIWLRVPLDSERKLIALASTSSNCKRQIHSIVREDVIYGF